MGNRDVRVDAYIAKSADFAHPILTYLRDVVHAACPDVEETLKWRMPAFMYKGILCGMGAFKQHCIFGFWKRKLVVGKTSEPAGMGPFGRITSMADLPSRKILASYVKKAARLNDEGVKAPRVAKPARKPLSVPKDLAAALARHKGAAARFDRFPPSHQREYIEWITDAKREETRTRRLATAIEQIAQGKPQNWKYVK